jgi:hypothetical protein
VNEVYEFVGVLCCDPAAESESKAEAPGMLCAVAGAQFALVYFSLLQFPCFTGTEVHILTHEERVAEGFKSGGPASSSVNLLASLVQKYKC